MFLLTNLFHGIQITPLFAGASSKSYLPIAYYSKKSMEALAGLPQKPKRPLPLFTRYVKEQYPEFKQNNPSLNTNELMKLLAKTWKIVDSDTKKRHMDAFESEKKLYQKEFEKYKINLTSEQKENIKTIKQERLKRREKILMRKREQTLGKPKGTASAFARFLADKIKRDPKAAGVAMTKYIKIAGESWKKLTDAEKQPYIEAYKKDLIRYNMEYEKWESKMIKEGHTDVIKSQIAVVPSGSK